MRFTEAACVTSGVLRLEELLDGVGLPLPALQGAQATTFYALTQAAVSTAQPSTQTCS